MEFIKCIEENGLKGKALPENIEKLILKYRTLLKEGGSLKELTRLDETICDKIDDYAESIHDDRAGIGFKDNDNDDVLESLHKKGVTKISEKDLKKAGFVFHKGSTHYDCGDYSIKKIKMALEYKIFKN